jgi:uncharacterized protein DUF4062
MPRNETVLVVFVASPEDVEPERNRLEEVIRELNVAWSRTLGVRLDLVRWETHGYPGIGSDAQDVLNRELPNDYDIFVGLMWGRYGTATGRAGSGTQEEFDQALARYRADPQSVKIMCYFKDAPLVPSIVDTEQLTKVQRFRASLGSEGALYWQFRAIEEFERLIRLHLTRQIQEILAPRAAREESIPREAREESITVAAATPSESPDEEELGLLDLLDTAEEQFSVVKQITERIGNESGELASKMNQRTEEMSLARQTALPGQLSRREARGLVERTAVDMNQYVARVRAELPLFRESMRNGADAITRAVLIQAGFGAEARTQIQTARADLCRLAESLGGAYEATAGFRARVQEMPRMTALLNRAKRDTAAVLEEVEEGFAAGRRILLEAIRTLDALPGDS